jgi:uncharacterized protein YegJ (DUF2314 family)
MMRLLLVFLGIDGDQITGRIANRPFALRTYSADQTVTIRAADLLDWTIVKPDGREEGNLRGKYIDALQAGRAASC